MNYFIFNTGGDWDTTSLYLNGEEFPADQLMIQIETGRDDYGEPRKGGLSNGGQATAFVMPQKVGEGEWALFPGKIDLEFPTHKVTIENQSPMFALELTRVWLDNEDVSDKLLDLTIDIDAVQNRATAYLTLFKPRFLGADEIATYTLI
jgi:hypothetical protein